MRIAWRFRDTHGAVIRLRIRNLQTRHRRRSPPCAGTWRTVSGDVGRALDFGRQRGDLSFPAARLPAGHAARAAAGGTPGRQPDRHPAPPRRHPGPTKMNRRRARHARTRGIFPGPAKTATCKSDRNRQRHWDYQFPLRNNGGYPVLTNNRLNSANPLKDGDAKLLVYGHPSMTAGLHRVRERSSRGFSRD